MKITVIGLGYVGLPLLISLSKKFSVVGFDISTDRVEDLINGVDTSSEIVGDEIKGFSGKITSDPTFIKGSDVIIISVPTPINENKTPELTPLINATEIASKYVKKGTIVIYESTVYPGCTNEVCIPILEDNSKLKLNIDFSVGYSPERISPGKNGKRLHEIVKVVSASNPQALETISFIYNEIIDAGVFPAPSIIAAEASKVFENTQRDVNIALMNEFSIILEKIGMHWSEVLPSAYTKWNFNRYHPGLVGGHCIGVDPYYLAYKANEVGIVPNLILAGRDINEEYPKKLATNYIKHKLSSKDDNILTVLAGATFKSNCEDIRNSKSEVFAKELSEYNDNFILFDPTCKNTRTEIHKYEIFKEINTIEKINLILLVPHDEFFNMLKSTNYISFYKCNINKIYSLTKIDDYEEAILL
jgi:UDP-N-acetyl-D-galactosamine dehydrogenase